jgi:Ca-activated chloride channel family protein
MRARFPAPPTLSIALLAAGLAVLPGGLGAAEPVQLQIALGHPVLRAGDRQTTYVKIGLTGARIHRESDRAPVNLALVIDTSSSMQGDKIVKAREAAIMAIQRLAANDIVSVVEYNSTVRVVVPATKLTDRESVCDAIRRLETRTNTALFAGVSKGAEEVRKFLGRDRVNRVVLISDGLANVGPSSPEELGELGSSLIREGISVTTIGLGDGYNEDLMSRLARRSDGSHYFAEGSTDLARIFQSELGDILTVAAQEVTVTIICADGIRPIRMLGRDAEIVGRKVIATLNQIYSEQEKYLLLEVEVPAMAAGATLPVATVDVAYANLQTKAGGAMQGSVAARFSDSAEAVEKEVNRDVMVAAIEQLANATSKLAVRLRDEGKVEEARKLILSNYGYLKDNAARFQSDKLQQQAEVQAADEKELDETKWRLRRKVIVEQQVRTEAQQKGVGTSGAAK